MKTPSEVLKSLQSHFNHKKVLSQLKDYLRAASTQMVYAVLLLYHAYRRPDTPTWAKRMILGTLAYVLAPIDAIPDLSPFFGFYDDLGMLMFGLVSIAGHINDEVKTNAREQIYRWFGEVKAEDLDRVERKIG